MVIMHYATIYLVFWYKNYLGDKAKYSRVHKSSDSFFSKILEKPYIVQK